VTQPIFYNTESSKTFFVCKDFNLQDQNGNAIEISPENSSSLTSAMILHEQAKNLMKSKEYLKALILLAEADNEFKNCSDKGLLEKTDNYGLLNLDIIWCHLCLENLNELKNAGRIMVIIGHTFQIIIDAIVILFLL
jgi:hypothetical protein